MTPEEQATRDAEARKAELLAAQNEPKRFIVLRPIRHGKKDLTPGDVVLFTQVQAQSLLEDGALRLAEVPSPNSNAIDLSRIDGSGSERYAAWTDGRRSPVEKLDYLKGATA